MVRRQSQWRPGRRRAGHRRCRPHAERRQRRRCRDDDHERRRRVCVRATARGRLHGGSDDARGSCADRVRPGRQPGSRQQRQPGGGDARDRHQRGSHDRLRLRVRRHLGVRVSRSEQQRREGRRRARHRRRRHHTHRHLGGKHDDVGGWQLRLQRARVGDVLGLRAGERRRQVSIDAEPAQRSAGAGSAKPQQQLRLRVHLGTDADHHLQRPGHSHPLDDRGRHARLRRHGTRFAFRRRAAGIARDRERPGPGQRGRPVGVNQCRRGPEPDQRVRIVAEPDRLRSHHHRERRELVCDGRLHRGRTRDPGRLADHEPEDRQPVDRS